LLQCLQYQAVDHRCTASSGDASLHRAAGCLHRTRSRACSVLGAPPANAAREPARISAISSLCLSNLTPSFSSAIQLLVDLRLGIATRCHRISPISRNRPRRPRCRL
jgi:hypothetical protein